MIKDNQSKCCGNISKPCAKFTVAAIISIATTTIGSILLFSKEDTLITIGASLLSSNLSFWLSPPNYSDN